MFHPNHYFHKTTVSASHARIVHSIVYPPFDRYEIALDIHIASLHCRWKLKWKLFYEIASAVVWRHPPRSCSDHRTDNIMTWITNSIDDVTCQTVNSKHPSVPCCPRIRSYIHFVCDAFAMCVLYTASNSFQTSLKLSPIPFVAVFQNANHRILQATEWEKERKQLQCIQMRTLTIV